MIYALGDFPCITGDTPPAAYCGWRIIGINVLIHIKGHLTHFAVVSPGDFIFGYDDQLQVIPRDHVDDVLLSAELIYKAKIEQKSLIREHHITLDDLYEKYEDP